MKTLEGPLQLSLAKYANYSLIAILIAMVAAIAAGLWIVHEQTRSHDAAIVALLAQKNAQILDQRLSLHQGRVSDAVVQATLEQIVQPDEGAVVRDASGRVIAQVGGVSRGNSWVRADADIAGNNWRLEMSRPASGHILAYLLKGAMVWIVVFVVAALVLLSFNVLRTTASELKHVGRFLREIGAGPFVTDAPACNIVETAALLPAIQRIATDLHKKEKTIAELSFTDNVTKLPNRLLFFDRFRHAFELAKRDTDICLLILEINELQKASDVLGHEGADATLRILADTLQALIRKSDFAARMGTSTFVTIFYNAKGAHMCGRLKQLQQDFAMRQQQGTVAAGEVYCTLSCGMTYVDPENDKRPEDTLLRAESAAQMAKKRGANQIAIVPPLRDGSGKLLTVARG